MFGLMGHMLLVSITTRLFFAPKSLKEDPSGETWSSDALLFQIPNGKKAIGDSAYEGLPEKVTVKRPGHSREAYEFIDKAQNRQESYHSRLENYSILYHRFYYGKDSKEKMALHKMAVVAVVVIFELDMIYHPLWDVE